MADLDLARMSDSRPERWTGVSNDEHAALQGAGHHALPVPDVDGFYGVDDDCSPNERVMVTFGMRIA